MSAVRRITRNAVLLNVARVISTLGKFFLFIYIARELGQETLGQFSFAIVFTSFFAIVISLGMDDLLVREIARDNRLAGKYLGNMFLMRMALSVLIFCLIVISAMIIGYPSSTQAAVFIFGGYAGFTSFSFLFRANFRAFEKMEWDALLEIIEALFTTIAGIILIFTGYGLIALCLAFFISSVINFILGYIINTKNFTKLKLQFDPVFWKMVFIKATPFAVFALFILYPQVDTILLTNLKGSADVGKYNAAYYILTAFSPVVMNFMIALVPIISRYFISAKTMLGYVYEKSVKYLLIIAFPVSVGAAALAPKLVGLLYGTGYNESIPALQILAWNCILLALSRPIFYVLGAINRQGTCAVITISALALSIVLNLILIPRFSFIGSSIVTLIIGSLVISASWYATKKYGFPLQVFKILWRPLLASFIMGFIVYGIDAISDANLPALVLLGVIVYTISLIAVQGFAKDDWNLIKEALHLRGRQVKTKNTPPESGQQLTEIKHQKII